MYNPSKYPFTSGEVKGLLPTTETVTNKPNNRILVCLFITLISDFSANPRYYAMRDLQLKIIYSNSHSILSTQLNRRRP